MFRENKRHFQFSLLSDLNALPAKHRTRLEESWAGTFRREVFSRLDEKPFAVLYADTPSRPNIPVNVLMGLETLKAGFGWSDAEMYDAFVFNVQVRYALGLDSLSEGEFELRTVYNFRHRLSEHLLRTGENLVEQSFNQITDAQLSAFHLKTGRLRMDSTQIASNICQMSRVQLLVEVLQRVHRLLSESDQAGYADAFVPYLKGSSGQYVYHLKGEDTAPHLHAIGELMQRLSTELAPAYAAEPVYQILQRVFGEQFVLTPASLPPAPDHTTALPAVLASETESRGEVLPPADTVSTARSDPAAVPPTEATVQAKPGRDISASSLRSPDDPEATYRKKGNTAYQGYVANVTETCDPDNPLQLIVKTQTAPNTTEDADLLIAAAPELKVRAGVNVLYNDGGFCGPAVDRVLRDLQVEQVPTGIRGKTPDPDRLGLADFQFQCEAEGRPLQVVCSQARSASVEPGRNEQRFIARFECADCPLSERCPTQAHQLDTRRSLHFTQPQVQVALRRQRKAQHPEAKNLRAAVEATVGALKRPFAEDQLPVRGCFRVGCMVVGSALMVNVRRIQRYLVGKNKSDEPNQVRPGAEGSPRQSLRSIFFRSGGHFQRLLRPAVPSLVAVAFRC